MDILIVGAGPTGLTAAIELARRGIFATVIDRRDSASTYSRAVGITPRSLQLLSPSGVAEQLIAEGIAMDGLRLYRNDALALALPLHSKRSFFPTILGLPQDRTEALMADTLCRLGGAVRYGVALTSFVEQGDRIVARFSDDTEETYDSLIGADGIDSTVRQQAGIAYAGVDLDEIWSIADVESDDWRHSGKITLVLAKPGTAVIVAPIGIHRYRVVASHADALSALPLPLNVTKVHREGTFNISVRQAQTYTKGSVHLAGDAAHCHSPVGGRGMNLGIADAVELAKRLVEGDVEGYSSVRHPAGERIMSVTERGRRMVTGKSGSRRIAVRLLLASANLISPVKRRLGRFFVEF